MLVVMLVMLVVMLVAVVMVVLMVVLLVVLMAVLMVVLMAVLKLVVTMTSLWFAMATVFGMISLRHAVLDQIYQRYINAHTLTLTHKRSPITPPLHTHPPKPFSHSFTLHKHRPPRTCRTDSSRSSPGSLSPWVCESVCDASGVKVRVSVMPRV